MVKQKNEVYKCSVCGNIVEVTHVGGGTLVCCGKEMILQKEQTDDVTLRQAQGDNIKAEKHVPVVEKTETGVKVSVGSVLHPMEEAHYIEWIEVISGENVYRKYLKPGERPVAEFEVKEVDSARAYCNVHGLWRN